MALEGTRGPPGAAGSFQQSLLTKRPRRTRRFSRSREIPCLFGLGCKYTRERGCDTVQLNGQSGGGMKRTTEDEEAMGGFPNRQESHEAWRRDLQRLQKISQNGGGQRCPPEPVRTQRESPPSQAFQLAGTSSPPSSLHNLQAISLKGQGAWTIGQLPQRDLRVPGHHGDARLRLRREPSSEGGPEMRTTSSVCPTKKTLSLRRATRCPGDPRRTSRTA